MWLLLMVVVVVATAAGEKEPRTREWLRPSGRPYGRHKSFASPVTSKYDPSYLTQGRGETTDNNDLLLRELYKNHNFDVDDHDGAKNTPDTDYSDSGYQNNYKRGLYGQNNRGFNRELDIRGFLNEMGGAAHGWGLDRGYQQDIIRKAGVWADAARLWQNTMRSDTGYGGAVGSSKLPIDVYSILALGLFTTFLAYLVYYYITTVNAEDARSLGSSRTDKVLWILDDVTKAFERWATFELLPQELLKEEEEEGEEKEPRLLDG